MLKDALRFDRREKDTLLFVRFYEVTGEKMYRVVMGNDQEAVFTDEEFFSFGLYEEGSHRETLGELEFKINSRRAYYCGVSFTRTSLKPAMAVREELLHYGYNDEELSEALNVLKAENYVDDEKYCRRQIEKKLAKGNTSKRMIFAELSAKGISEDLIGKCLADTETDDFATALKIAVKKKNLGDKKDKIARYLAGKGFSGSIIFKVLEEMDFDDEEEKN